MVPGMSGGLSGYHYCFTLQLITMRITTNSKPWEALPGQFAWFVSEGKDPALVYIVDKAKDYLSGVNILFIEQPKYIGGIGIADKATLKQFIGEVTITQ